jgi:hypothetical protein
MFATVPGCSRIACKSTDYTLSMFLVVRGHSWRVGVLIGVHILGFQGLVFLGEGGGLINPAKLRQHSFAPLLVRAGLFPH